MLVVPHARLRLALGFFHSHRIFILTLLQNILLAYILRLQDIRICRLNVIYSTERNFVRIRKIDCYERLAIGHRLKSEDIYKTVDANTVPKCQKECTIGGDKCKAFSFGIAIKGNSTCELGENFISETSDLQPIGTITDVDFDLYIKKLGCKLIVDQGAKISKPYLNNQFLQSTLTSNNNYQKQHITTSEPNHQVYEQLSIQINKNENKNLHEIATQIKQTSNNNEPLKISQKPTVTYGVSIPNIDTNQLNRHNNDTKLNKWPLTKFEQGNYDKPSNYDVQHVKGSLLSVSTGPLSYLHPVHEILIGRNPHLYGEPKPNLPLGDTPDRTGSYDKPMPFPHLGNERLNEEYKNDDNRRLNGYFNDYPEYYSVQNKYENPNSNQQVFRWSDNNYMNRQQRPGHLSGLNDRQYALPSYNYNDETFYRNKQNQHRLPFFNPPDGNSFLERKNDFGYGMNTFTRENEKPSHNIDIEYEGIIEQNTYDHKSLRNKLSSNTYHIGSFHSAPYNYKNKLSKLEYPINWKSIPYYENLHESPVRKVSQSNNYEIQLNDDSFPLRPMDFDKSLYDQQLIKPHHAELVHHDIPKILHDRKDEVTNERPYYRDHKTSTLQPFQGYKGPLKSQYLNYVEDSAVRSINLEYLFNENGRYDIESHASQLVHLKPNSNQNKNVSEHSNSTLHETRNTETRPKDSAFKPKITESIGVDGENIISIITELNSACFRRVFAGKRVSRRFVKKFLLCERIEDCQYECGEEKYFVCEGFNYRLDPMGRGKGECELLDVPLQMLDIGRDVYPDRQYDYYERDRNTARTHCQNEPPHADYGAKSSTYIPAAYEHPLNVRRPGYGYYQSHKFDTGPYKYDRRTPYYDKRPILDYDRRRPPNHDNRLPSHETDNNWRRDTPYYHSHHIEHSYESHSHIDRNDNIKHGTHYLPPNLSPEPIFAPQYDLKPFYSKSYNYGQIGKKKYDEANYNRFHYKNERRNFYLPPRVGGTKDWGKYGGSYGNFGHEYDHSFENVLSSNHWSLENRNDYKPADGQVLPPVKTGSYLPSNALEINLILPAEPRITPHSYLKEDCSLRSATGFRLAKVRVKKFYVVPNIYECELLCFTERTFACASYAFRYTMSLSSPSDNCYLSDKNYKELDYYTDLQPDRDFDIYTMNNMNKCISPVITSKDSSDCFWRVRTGYKLDHRMVKDSLTVTSIVDCQIECLKSRRFMCRVFSFRFGSHRSDSSLHNCQLTDWSYYEFDSRIDFVPEASFEIYERGSFGHGCEPYHFDVRGRPSKNSHVEVDKLCYIGFGLPARLLPGATMKYLTVENQLDCKAECSKLKEKSNLQCMSFSYRTRSYGGYNCFLSDIQQRDLLNHYDYIPDPHSRLFAWDNYNPQCTSLTHKRLHGDRHNYIGREEIHGTFSEEGTLTTLDTWKTYSVSGWPCKRGHLCQQNLEAGFWFCELEGGDVDAWDYCCRPDHQCGYSYGISYPWCYVGPEKTQWRECSDRYYPYIHNLIDRFYDDKKYQLTRPSLLILEPTHEGLPTQHSPQYGGKPPLLTSPSFRPDFRPDLPPLIPQERPPGPSLDEYEMQFDEQFLAPPKPGGFGQPRHWPVSYLHKDRPPNITDAKTRLMTPEGNEESKSKFRAIQSLIDIINSNKLKNVQYQITNESNNEDDVLFVKIPLPSKFTEQNKTDGTRYTLQSKLEHINITKSSNNVTRRSNKSLDFVEIPVTMRIKKNFDTLLPTYRRSYITRTNVTEHGRFALNKVP